MGRKYNYNELAHLSVNCAIWIRHLIEGMPLFEPIGPEMILKVKELGCSTVLTIRPYEYLHDNFEGWFENLAPDWVEIANRRKPKRKRVYDETFVKNICLEYACANFDNIFDKWFEDYYSDFKETI